MPELPEVETVVRDLRPELVGRRITAIRRGTKKLRKAWKPAWDGFLAERSIHAVERRGKWIHVHLDRGFLVVHLGMTGQFQVLPINDPVADHTHFQFVLDDPAKTLRYTDIRRFGSVQLFDTLEEWQATVDEKLGPEPWDVTPGYWREQLEKAKRNLKAFLLDQSIIAGVGNIYADESLHLAGIRPTTLANALTKQRGERLRLSIIEILNRAIASRGSTIRNYVGGSGLKGQFQDGFHVYGRTDQPCLKCGKPIEWLRLAGRSTHYCPRCQK